jgi:hypothetical protein
MCDLARQSDADFGFLVDAPEIRSLIFETRRLTEEIDDHARARRGAAAAFAKLLAADNWLPKEYSEPDFKSGMGGGIGQYALYRAETDRSASSRSSFPRARRRRFTITSRGD